MLNRGTHRKGVGRGLPETSDGWLRSEGVGGADCEGKGRRVFPMSINVGSLDFIRLCRPTADDVCSDGDICSTILIVATTKTCGNTFSFRKNNE